ncbi:hypothetical protein [Streptomyces sp. NPDC058613]|uniref:hypothetical protein n=1 Tax=Streptomyces sp. NPDC058613 TaxID=3346556 RepID=UPI0036519711
MGSMVKGLMAMVCVVCVSLYLILKKRDWLWPTAPGRLVRVSVKSKSSARQGMLNRYSDTVPTRSGCLSGRRIVRHGF